MKIKVSNNAEILTLLVTLKIEVIKLYSHFKLLQLFLQQALNNIPMLLIAAINDIF
jgi:hypothetical protein